MVSQNAEWAIEGAAVIFLVRLVATEAGLGRASHRGSTVLFHPVLMVRLVFGFAIPTLLYGTAQVIRTREWLAAIIGIVMAAFIFFTWPGTIRVDKAFIREIRWLGLRHTRIAWGDVVFAGGDTENRITIRSKDDRIISHTPYHVDRAGFIQALKQYCPLWAKQSS